jgi:hypothetical protein
VVEETMKKTVVITLLLAVLAAVLLGYLLLTSTPDKTTSQPPQWEPVAIIHDNASVAKIVLERPLGRLVFEYVPEHKLWVLREPVETFAEEKYFHLLRGNLFALKKEKIIELSPPDLAKYGLDHPLYRFHLTFSDGHPDLVLEIGNMNYNHTHYYAKTADDDTVFLVSNELEMFLEAPLESYRAKKLMFSTPDDILSFEIKVPDPATKSLYPRGLEPRVVAQKDAGQQAEWIIVKPVTENGDRKAVESFLFRLHNISTEKIYDLPDGNLSPYGLDQPKVVVAISLRDGVSREEIRFGNPVAEGEGYYAGNMARPEVLVVDPGLFKMAAEAHFRKAQPLDPSRRLIMDKLVLEFPRQPKKNMTFIREGRRVYHLENDPQVKTLRKNISFFISPFYSTNMGIYAHDLSSAAEHGLDPALLHIKVYEGQEVALDVSVGNTTGDEGGIFTFCTDNKRGIIFIIGQDLSQTMPLEREDIIADPNEVEEAYRQIKQRKEREMSPEEGDEEP